MLADKLVIGKLFDCERGVISRVVDGLLFKGVVIAFSY